jgi:glycosyltransferase involved in cell wall biosynthesis
MKEVMERYGIPRVTVIPHGTDNVSSVDEIADHNRIIFFGFVRPSKGVDTLILALEGIKKVCNDVKLTIAGSIPFGKEAYYLGLLKSLIDQHGLHDAVEFITKFLTPQEIRQLLSGATVVVLPYRDEFVEVSGVAHDIAGFGISLVCSNTPRFSEFIDGFDCIKVDLTPDSLAHALTKLLSNRELREKLGKNIRLRATSESWDKVSAMHTDLYRQILEGC